MPTVWISLKKTLHCKTDPSEVHEPKPKLRQSLHFSSLLGRKRPCRSGCTRSIANLKDVVVPGSRKEHERPPSCSPRSIGSTEFANPITHEVVLSGSRCELKITGIGQEAADTGPFVGMLRPGTPGPGWAVPGNASPLFTRCSTTPTRKSNLLLCGEKEEEFGLGENGGRHSVAGNGALSRASCHEGGRSSNGGMICHKCGEQFVKLENLEAHHLSKHAVTELLEGDSSRRIVEIICRASWPKPDNPFNKIERILKVHNMHRTLARFEEYREAVKAKASKLSKKHPRCLADGNELLRFYGTTVSCSLGSNGLSTLCGSLKCNVCRIIRHGFTTKKEMKEGVGIFTTSTSGRALESIEITGENTAIRKVLLVCRVIAGRVHKPMENLQVFSGQLGFDSVAGKIGPYSNIEELYLLNPKALLPCFVVICKP
ncbi:C2H2-like zinc finger protein [Rhynchospora pubera]|uniref:C2H2-like zinc finger protein n=1 Tax=Rhynchospora pubera TaxID=906938 RepID=A0AAV8CQP6_9POAL|nr:C2H2-like zinc finger protein [Rhynchospora pubera]KAJ4757761.1 C2H2-like zinc finger protein [Rhynchospora pubera]KAJ4798629.1 C2H2-like zinc finger protein [Rhynchospora pubera]